MDEEYFSSNIVPLDQKTYFTHRLKILFDFMTLMHFQQYQVDPHVPNPAIINYFDKSPNPN